ncbi:MAG: TetR/AcrR family transcriptional regulator [Lachnospira sp.]|nr:TetR/AcrR family transcriptional regulator [Lachnospira sp.]
MPKFGEQEKVRIKQCLLVEGERLFSTYGLKKATIDDIVKAVNIAKASFYKFYDGKEYLFLDIAQREQKEIFDALEGVLIESKDKSDKERVKLVFFTMSGLMRRYPLLAGIDKETVEIIARKVSPQRLKEYSIQGFDAVKTMEKHGIVFRYDTQVVSQLFQALYQSWIALQGQPVEVQEQVINIMLEGLINQIIGEKNA